MSSSVDASNSVTVAVLTLNEERHLDACLSSARALTHRLLVLDSGSTDRTVEIARTHGADVRYREFSGYADQRNAALEMVDSEWVLFLDADEYLTEPLVAEIRDALERVELGVSGFWIPRENRFWNTSLRGGGWWPDKQFRLFRPDRVRYDPNHQVHERVIVSGSERHLTERLVHINVESLAEFRATERRYADMRADQYLVSGVTGRRRTLIGRPLREFWRRFITLHGYRNGLLGLFLALAMARYEFRTWWRVRSGKVRKQHIAASSPVALSQPDPGLDLSIIIVSYNTSDLLRNCLASIEAWYEASGKNGEVIVVDNASVDGTVDMVRRRFPSVRLIENQRNVGFAAANNLGIRAARGKHIVLLNPDTTVVGDAFGVLGDYLDRHPDVGVVGPKLVFPDGRTQSSRRRFPTRLTAFLESTVLQEYLPNNRVVRRYYMADQPDSVTQQVDWLVGACLMVRRDALASAGLLDERYFMYSEEVEWCYRMGEAGWRIVYLPTATVVHYEGSSSSQNIPARQINFDASKVLLHEQLHGRFTARSLHLFLLATYALRIGLESGKGLIGHKRPLRWERVGMYSRVLAARIRKSGGA